jgi:hypothetical protein
MTNRMDNLQTVFDRTDWKALKAQKADLLAAITDAEHLCHWDITHGLQGLLNWLDAMQDAATMDGYQVKHLTEESTS